jgi:hypothetical protein
MSTGPNATPNGTHKVHKKVEDTGKGKDDGNKNIIVTVAGVVVASGIAFSLYKTFHKEDHPLVNTERGIKQDASNALDGTRVRIWILTLWFANCGTLSYKMFGRQNELVSVVFRCGF